MESVFFWTQIISASFVIFLVTIQTRGGGLGRSFGQLSNTSFKRRGVEKLVFRFTFVFSFIFMVSSILRLLM